MTPKIDILTSGKIYRWLLPSYTSYLTKINFFFKINLFILFILFILFLAALGLHCCVQAFSTCGEQGLLFVAVRGLLITVASLVAEHRLQVRGLQ